MKLLRYPLACIALLCLLGCPPMNGTEEQRKHWRESGPCADSLFLALSHRPVDSLTSYERQDLQRLQQECDHWMFQQELSVRTQESSGMWLLVLLPPVGLTVGLLLAFL